MDGEIADINRQMQSKRLNELNQSLDENISANDTFSLQTSDILSKINEFIQNNAFF
jgi:hypothetical protein